ncbi:MAG: RluA family pseudouridine synthase [Clostridia bacterium]|nr:RluA family pseudouridine synthase [Clostridia bacterium]
MIREYMGNGERLDVLLSSDGELSRSRAAALIKEGCVKVGERIETKPSLKTVTGVPVIVTLPEVKPAKAEAQDIPLEILYQDEHLAVIVKPCGMVVHPAAGNDNGTLVNALLYHLDSLSGIGGEMRPGIVHRLDKDTSGLMLVAKDDATHAALSQQLSERRMEKHYRAMVYGKMKEPAGVIEKPIGRSKTDRKKMAVDENGRWAKTEWRVLKEYSDRSLLDVHIITGRTHQIRVHMASIGHPVLGDPLYGHKRMPIVDRLMLHAFSLEFTHPATGERLRFTAPCPFCAEESEE